MILFLNGTEGIWLLDCSLKGNASIAGGQRSAAPGSKERYVCSLQGNASIAGGQRSAALGSKEDLFLNGTAREFGRWIVP